MGNPFVAKTCSLHLFGFGHVLLLALSPSGVIVAFVLAPFHRFCLGLRSSFAFVLKIPTNSVNANFKNTKQISE
jgi:hypothetical protein